MHNVLIQDMAAILLTGGIFGWIFKKIFKLPLILGYIFGGALLVLPIAHTPEVVSKESANTLAEIGVLLLMFSMGLHFGLRKIRSIGLAPVLVGISQALLMWFTGTCIAHLWGISGHYALFLGAALAPSSTAVIVKILDELGLKSARFAEKLLAVLMVEDSVAIFIIIWLSATSGGQSFPLWEILPIFILSILLWWLLGTLLLPRIVQAAFRTGREELLVILSIGLALGMAYLSSASNYSSALGAFIMGSILSECRELKKIEALIEPVKNLFGLVFFVSIGFLFSPAIIIQQWSFIGSLVLTVITGKILYNFLLNVFLGQGVKDSLRMGGVMGQIGELSFVIAQAGMQRGKMDIDTFSSVVATAIITMLATPFCVRISLFLADKAENIFPKPVYKFVETYSQSIMGFSLQNKMAPFYKKFSLFESFKFLIGDIKSKLRKNYMLITSKNVTSTLDRLAPWDEYLVPVHVSPDAVSVGKTLMELKFRESFGVNIVAIERNNRTIVSPKANEIVMPGDTLLAYGNEEAMAELGHFLNNDQANEDQVSTLDQCILIVVKLKEGHPFIKKSILELGIRNHYNCIVLAINRKNQRIKNPISSFVFEENDELFVFGTRHSLEKIVELQYKGTS